MKDAIAARRTYSGIMLGTAACAVWQSQVAMSVALAVNVVIWILAIHAMTMDINKEGRMKE